MATEIHSVGVDRQFQKQLDKEFGKCSEKEDFLCFYVCVYSIDSDSREELQTGTTERLECLYHARILNLHGNKKRKGWESPHAKLGTRRELEE